MVEHFWVLKFQSQITLFKKYIFCASSLQKYFSNIFVDNFNQCVTINKGFHGMSPNANFTLVGVFSDILRVNQNT